MSGAGGKVAVIDGGGANIASLMFALERQGARGTLTSDPCVIRHASHVVLPGVGAAADAMQRLHAAGIAQLIGELSQPVLGICLGMQLLCEASQEDDAVCLGVAPGVAAQLTAGTDCPVPHMGWNSLHDLGASRLLAGIPEGSYAYFVHSYALPVNECTVSTTHYTIDFCSVLERDNFFATQFHPERSAAVGARLLANFLAL